MATFKGSSGGFVNDLIKLIEVSKDVHKHELEGDFDDDQVSITMQFKDGTWGSLTFVRAHNRADFGATE